VVISRARGIALHNSPPANIPETPTWKDYYIIIIIMVSMIRDEVDYQFPTNSPPPDLIADRCRQLTSLGSVSTCAHFSQASASASPSSSPSSSSSSPSSSPVTPLSTCLIQTSSFPRWRMANELTLYILQIEKGPVDSCSHDARYSLSEDRLLR